MRRSTIPLVLACLWSLCRIGLLLFYVLSDYFPWGELRANLALVWFATPGIAVGILAVLQLGNEKSQPGIRNAMVILLIVDILVGLAALILSASDLGINGISSEELEPFAYIFWNLGIPGIVTAINGLLLWVLYNQKFESVSEE